MPDDDPRAPQPDRALVQKLRVVDGESLRFVETGNVRDDTFDLGWEATPAPAERLDLRGPKPTPRRPQQPPAPAPGPSDENPFEAEVERLFSADPTPLPPIPSRYGPSPSPSPSPPPPPPSPPVAPRVPAAPVLDGATETRPVVFQHLDDKILRGAMSSFDVLDVVAGETLIGAGERHPALVMPLRGTLEAARPGSRMRVASGEVLGLTTLFGNGVWPFTLTALTDARLLVLELDAYQALRSAGSRVALAIEEHALDALLDGLEHAASELADRLAARPLREIVPSKGLLARFAAVMGGGGLSPAKVDVVEALAASDLFRNAARAQLEAMRDRWEGVRVGPGEFLVRQGEPGTHLYLLVSGAVDVISAVGPDQAVRYETLRPGDLFDGWSMLRDRGGWASSVVKESSVLLELEKPAWAELASGRDAVGSVLRLAMLRSLTRRLVQARALLLELQGHDRSLVGDAPSSRFVTINPPDRR